MGMESEFNIWVDEVEVTPETYWKSPLDFIDQPLLPRVGSSHQLPTGGAIYFDRGVIEVVTPLVEIAPRCSARVVRSLWEQIGFVRENLSRWEQRTGHTLRLRGYSSHYNVSYEVPRAQQNRRRNVGALAHLLAFLLPPPLMVLATNRLSTGVGVRPRGDRVEITIDFTPDPALMVATATAVVGIVREVMSWEAHDPAVLDSLPIPRLAGVIPGRHTTRKGWLTKDQNYPRNPFTTSIDDPVWLCTDGRIRSMREIGWETAWHFRRSIRRYGDAFSSRLVFGVLRGEQRSMLELAARPVAYDHVGVLCRWGTVLADLILEDAARLPRIWRRSRADSAAEYVAQKAMELREEFLDGEDEGLASPSAEERTGGPRDSKRESNGRVSAPVRRSTGPRPRQAQGRETQRVEGPERRKSDRRLLERRKIASRGRRLLDRRGSKPYPDAGLNRSRYEQVFLMLTSGQRLRIDDQWWTPVGMESWYRARLRRDSDGVEETITIDELLGVLERRHE